MIEASSIESMVARGRDPVRPELAAWRRSPTRWIDHRRDHRTNLPTIQGTAQNNAYVAVDGVGSADGDTGNNNGITSMDAIAEVRVVLNSYSAEFGRNTGPQINVVTKSGTQKHAGSLSGIVRHEALNSNTLANERLGVEKPIARYYVGVGTLGGPVWLPGKSKLARTFFFYTRAVGHERRIERQHEEDADRARARGRLFADDADQWDPVLHQDPTRSGWHAARRRVGQDASTATRFLRTVSTRLAWPSSTCFRSRTSLTTA